LILNLNPLSSFTVKLAQGQKERAWTVLIHGAIMNQGM